MSQPDPKPSAHPAVWPMVAGDMSRRYLEGRKRYGTPLRPFNGRDALKDAYEEALDLVVYLRQAIYERDHLTHPIECSICHRRESANKPCWAGDRLCVWCYAKREGWDGSGVLGYSVGAERSDVGQERPVDQRPEPGPAVQDARAGGGGTRPVLIPEPAASGPQGEAVFASPGGEHEPPPAVNWLIILTMIFLIVVFAFDAAAHFWPR